MTEIAALVRRHVRDLRPYTTARDIYAGGGAERILLDANESPYDTTEDTAAIGLNRYPDPRCSETRSVLCDWLGVDGDRLWLGNGSDEAVDLLLRTFVEPGEPVVICSPTYALYGIVARGHGAEVREVPLDTRFDLDVESVLAAAREANIVFMCSPNNPTANRLSSDRIAAIARRSSGLVVLDEAYVEFSDEPSLIELLDELGNLVVLRTLSKAWGLAGARVGYMVASSEVIAFVDRINLPYPLNTLSASVAARTLRRPEVMRDRVRAMIAERERFGERLRALGFAVFPSDANFLLVRIPGAREVHRRLAEEHRIVVRDRSDLPGLHDCIRISVGRREDMERVCTALEAILHGEKR